VCDEVSSSFVKLSQCPFVVEDSDLQALERFVVLMYDRSRDVTTVNEASLDLFARKQRPYDSIPQTQAALKEHPKRAFYEVGHVGTGIDVTARNDEPIRKVENLVDSSWTYCKELSGVDQMWVHLACTGRCKCYIYGLSCTCLYSCPGQV